MNLKFTVSNQTNPYVNVAVENWLVAQPDNDSVVLYLWKNHRTVVIGQNQNPFAECDVQRLNADGGYVMRRTTGGGAVYHDDGNINFSFVASPSLYDQAKHFDVIAQALKHFGIEAEVSGRNDLLANGRKFSGNAFSKGRHQWLHHGTLLIRGNVDDLSRYLRVKPSKLHKHGVASVQSRIVNLSELNPSLNSDNIVPHLLSAFESTYGAKAQSVDFDQIVSQPDTQELTAKYSSKEWLYGRWQNFTAQYARQFDWGEVELSITVDEATQTITDVALATDALDVELSAKVRNLLVGASTLTPPTTNDKIISDILTLIW